jgi:VanZ family protein
MKKGTALINLPGAGDEIADVIACLITAFT